MSLFRAASLLLLSAAVVAGCSSNPSGNRIDYSTKAVVTGPLDVPPPLVLPVAGSEGVELPGATGKALLPQPINARLARDGDLRWLVVDGAPETVWPRAREFLKNQGLDIRQEEARIGLLETEWAENRAGMPDTFLHRLLPKLHDADTRDKYRLRLERGTQPGTTEIFLTHYGAAKVDAGEGFIWQPRPSDPELVTEMLSRMMLAFGMTPEQASSQLANKEAAVPRARLTGDTLFIDEGFPRAWRLTGLALDRVGLVVEDLNRDKGIYYVRQTEEFAKEEDQRGFFSRLFSSDKPEDKRFQLVLKGDDNSSRLTALDHKGEVLSPEVNKRILERLQERLR